MAKPNLKVLIDLSSGLEWNAASEQDITQWVSQVAVRRGRTRLINDFEAGTAAVTLFDDGNVPSIPADYIQTGKIKITVQPFSTEYPVFYGFISNVDSQFNQSTDEISKMTYNCVDAFRLFNNAVITTVTGASAQLSGTRVNKILDQIGYPAGLRDIDAGNTSCQADPGTQRSALDALRTIEKTEAGAFYIAADGDATFLDRSALYGKLGTASSLTLPVAFIDYPINPSIIGPVVQYVNAVVKADDDIVYNDITVTRLGGTAQNKQDAASIAAYFKRSAARTGVLMQTDSEAADLASVMLETYKESETRIDQILVDVSEVDSDKAERVFPLELCDLASAGKFLPDGSRISNQNYMIQGIYSNYTPLRSTITYYIGEPLLKGFILNDWVYGRLDYNGLGY